MPRAPHSNHPRYTCHAHPMSVDAPVAEGVVPGQNEPHQPRVARRGFNDAPVTCGDAKKAGTDEHAFSGVHARPLKQQAGQMEAFARTCP